MVYRLFDWYIMLRRVVEKKKKRYVADVYDNYDI